MNNNLQSLADNLMGYCQKELGFKEPPSLFFEEDPQNAEDTLGKTAYYEPAAKKVVIYVTGRHNKDILRSIAHELIHHVQNLRGEFDNDHDTSPGYAQKDSHMRNMEKEAYLLGNLLFRDWEDGLKSKRMQENKEINPVNDNIKELVKNAILEELSEEKDEDYFRTPLDKDEQLKDRIKSQIQKKVDLATGKKKPARPPAKNEVFGLSSKNKMDTAVEKEAEYNKRIDMKKKHLDPRTHLNKYGDPIWPDGSPRLHSKSHGVGELEAEELPELEEGEERERADNEPPHPYDDGQYHGQDRDSTGKKIKKEVHNMNIDTIKEMIKEKLLEALKSEGKMPMGPGPDGKKGTKDDRPAFVDQDKPEEEGNIENMPPQLRATAKKKQKQNEEQEIFAPNHYCVHHGGVQHNGSVQMAEAVSHNYNKELGRVTHYDMKLEDGTILEGVAAEDIQVTNASLANEHMHAVRDDDEEEKKMQEADLDEMHCGKRDEEDLEERVSKHDKQEYQGMPRSAYEAEYMRRKEEEEKEKEGKLKEGKIQTPEQEKLLYESRFTGRDTDLFNRLVNKWIK